MIIEYEIAFDCAEPDRVAAFWRTALDYVQKMPSAEELEAAYEAHPEWRDIAIVEDELARHPRLYLQRVAEPKIGRNRLTFEVSLPASHFPAEVDRLLSLGASRVGDEWFADPEGNEFLVFAGDGVRRFSAIVFDALDPARLADFWGRTLGFHVSADRCDRPDDWLVMESGELIVNGRRTGCRFPGEANPIDGPVAITTPGFKFRRTNQPKVRKNRVHIDLVHTDVETDRADVFSRGATREDLATGHRGMFDPEENEFCLHEDAMFDGQALELR